MGRYNLGGAREKMPLQYFFYLIVSVPTGFNPLNTELNPICQ